MEICGGLLFIIIKHNFVQPFLQLTSLRSADSYTVLTDTGYRRLLNKLYAILTNAPPKKSIDPFIHPDSDNNNLVRPNRRRKHEILQNDFSHGAHKAHGEKSK